MDRIRASVDSRLSSAAVSPRLNAASTYARSARHKRGGAMYVRLTTLTALIALAVLVLGGVTASAQSAELILVRNTHATTNATIDITQDRAMGFRTGPNAGGYLLSSVELSMLINNPSGTYPTYSVELWSTDSDADPAAPLATLTNPDSLNTGLNKFTAPGGYLLDPNTRYAIAFIVSDNEGADIGAGLRVTNAGSEFGEAGWLINHSYVSRAIGSPSWTDVAQSQTPIFQVNGYTDTTPPAFQNAEVNFSTLTMTFDDTLDPDSVPAASSFSVGVTPGFDGSRTVAVSRVDISGSTLTLTLFRPVRHNMAVTVSYAPPASNPLQDGLGNDAAQFTNQPVTNTTPEYDDVLNLDGEGVVYVAPTGGHRVVRDPDGQCADELFVSPRGADQWIGTGYSYGSGDDGCRQAAWNAYRRSIGQEPLSPGDDAFPAGNPPALAGFSCPSGWQPRIDAEAGTQLCTNAGDGVTGIALGPERAREFVRLGLRASDLESTNELRNRNYWTFVFGGPCTHGARYGYVGGELTCVGGLYSPERPQPEFDKNATPLELVTVWQPPSRDPETGHLTRGHSAVQRDVNGNVVTRERSDPNRPCASASWIESLWQWVCTRDGDYPPVDPVGPAPQDPESTPTPVEHPEPSVTYIDHDQSSHPPAPPCTQEQLEWLEGPGLRFAFCTR